MDRAKPSWRPPLGLGLFAVLTTAAALRLWRLSQNGFGNEYYTAGVSSMSAGWHNFLYHAFDPAGFISVDKPPVAMWIQVATVKLFGFHGLSVLVPQVLEGLAAVCARLPPGPAPVRRRRPGCWRRSSSRSRPVSVAVDRSSNTDSCLLLRSAPRRVGADAAAEAGSRRLLLLAMALVGVAFNVKMLAAFVVLPTFALVYFVGARRGLWRRRVVDLAARAASCWRWCRLSLGRSSTISRQPDRRPYAGTTDKNSVLELAVGPYGIGRFVRQIAPSSGARRSRRSSVPGRVATPTAGGADRAAAPGPAPRCRATIRAGAGGAAAPRRRPARRAGRLAAYRSRWPGWCSARSRDRAREAARLRRASRCSCGRAGLVTYGAVYSYAGGFFHFYYLADDGAAARRRSPASAS